MSGRAVTYEGGDVQVAWDGRLCIHVGECTRAKGELFVSGRKPWCDPDTVPADDVAAVVRRCPSGALTYIRTDGGPVEAAPARNTVTVANAGPLYAHGDLHIAGAPGDMPGVRFRAALCRCGQSRNKPFCDNSHEAVDFTDHGAVGDTGPGRDADGGPLEIQAMPNGPYILRGNLTIVSGAGRPAWEGTQAALCRCGSSTNKPFCDGSHKEIGFTG